MIGAYGNLFMSDKQLTLAEFLEIEMNQRKMSVREFARFVGVSHSVISKHHNKEDITPSIDFLLKLSEKTETNLQAVLAMAFPDVMKKTALSPRATILAQRFDNLSEPIQDMLLSFVVSQK